MAQPRLPTPLSRRDTVAILLILVGLFGMARHFSAKPEPASSPAPRTTASTFTAPPLPRFAGATEAVRPSVAVQAMRRHLREFIIPWPNIKSLPVSDALALLHYHWHTLPHETEAIPPATFILSESAAQQVAAAQPPVRVSLEIPGVSLLTHLQLLAAQAGLHLRVTESGAITETSHNRASPEIETTSFPLAALTLQHFTSRAQRLLNAQAATLDESTRRDNFLVPSNGVQVTIMMETNSESAAKAIPTSIINQLPPPSFAVPKPDIEDEGYPIDLNMPPDEEIESEGFINHGSPIQTTGIPALSREYLEEQGILVADSRVTQPVFATRLLSNQKQALTKLLAAVGITERSTPTGPQNLPETGFAWDPGFNSIIVIGPQRIQRISTETVAAVHEAATAGATLEFATGDWLNNEPPTEPTPDSSKSRPATAPAPNQASAGYGNKHTHQKQRFGIPMSGWLPHLRTDFDYLGPGSTRSLIEKAGARFRLDLTLSLPILGLGFHDLGRDPTQSFDIPVQWINPDHWHRINLPDRSTTSSGPRQSLFVRINRTTVPTD